LPLLPGLPAETERGLGYGDQLTPVTAIDKHLGANLLDAWSPTPWTLGPFDPDRIDAGPGAPHRFDPFDAARVAAWVHGRAGDLAAADLGELSLTARDLITWLPRAFPAIVAPAG
jgi:NAD(P)H-hydrate repair Nnr-like enzyme with NAD(P)H-hydrate dehydratase domain